MANAFAERGGWWVVAQAVLMLGVVILGGTHGSQWHSRPLFILGGVMFALGALLGTWGMKALGANRTAYPKPVDAGVLIDSGPYGLVRHPLYASVILLSLGWGLLLSSPASLAVSVVLTCFFHAKAAREERWLRARYPGYEAYARRVKRLIPWVW
jgi:protein-S-isoprenylcysteine O-methyltransferase Ste14